MDRLKRILFSEKGMRIVNALFFLSMIFSGSGLMFPACIAWIAYLASCIRRTGSKGSRMVYCLFIGIAALMICVNLHFLIRK